MLGMLTSFVSSVMLESDRIISAQEKYNLATFMVLFLLITIEVMIVKVVTAEAEREEEDLTVTASARFFGREDQ